MGGLAEKTRLSCCIIARNEADRIEACIRSVQGVADEVVLVDSGSTDDTVERAKALGGRVLHRDWTGYGPQKRFAEEQAAFDWVLNLDADEALSPELAAEIAELMAGPPLAAYRMRIVGVHPGRDRPHRGAEEYNVVRLYDRRVVRYSQSPVHDRVETEGHAVGQLKGIVLHRSWRTLAHLRAKLEAYADYQVEKLRKPVWVIVLRLPFEYPFVFLKYLIGRGNMWGGWTGLRIAHMTAVVRTRRLAKMLRAAVQGAS